MKIPLPLRWLLVAYFAASLAHFAHNAEYIAFYPGMPSWLGRGDVYLAWLAVTAVGAVGLAFGAIGWRVAAWATVALYGALGLDGLAHYTLALCSEHTWAMNLTIWGEAVTGSLLAIAAVRLAAAQAFGVRAASA